MCKFKKDIDGIDCCVECNEELSIMERNRSNCWSCQDKVTETYSDDHIEMEDKVRTAKQINF
ncbi:hypothetical protein CN692_14705 [Bacillus sp. AFS002410]|uniref:hypothetical protein n=1 Tax=Bacillus sp. AFS002410 TaxID=2033481 RepID=UPI000BF00355|nr:hypothetical protein [Bacillus sp. AFS002410]PEJ57135.1 hypothetical protein CN692_14705 [Bacillus sp. AFS002410]